MRTTDLYTDGRGHNYGLIPDAESVCNKKLRADFERDGRAGFIVIEPPYMPFDVEGFTNKVKQIALSNQRVYREVSAVYGVKPTVNSQSRLWSFISKSNTQDLAKVVKIISTCRKYTAYQFHQEVPFKQDAFVVVDRLPKEVGDTAQVIIDILFDRFYIIYRMDKDWKPYAKLESISSNSLKQLRRSGLDHHMLLRYDAEPFIKE